MERRKVKVILNTRSQYKN